MIFDYIKLTKNKYYLIFTKYSFLKNTLIHNKFIEYYDNRSTDIGSSSNSKKYYI